jgi:hypothetical protein
MEVAATYERRKKRIVKTPGEKLVVIICEFKTKFHPAGTFSPLKIIYT